MRKLQPKITIRLIAATFVTVAVLGLSAIAMHAPTQNQNSLALKRIQTDNATVFYADNSGNNIWFVEAVLPGTIEGKAATDNLKIVAATL